MFASHRIQERESQSLMVWLSSYAGVSHFLICIAVQELKLQVYKLSASYSVTALTVREEVTYNQSLLTWVSRTCLKLYHWKFCLFLKLPSIIFGDLEGFIIWVGADIWLDSHKNLSIAVTDLYSVC